MFIKINNIIIPTYKPESNSVSRSICLSATFLRLNCRIDFDEFWNTSRWDLEEVYRKPWAKVMLKYIFKRYLENERDWHESMKTSTFRSWYYKLRSFSFVLHNECSGDWIFFVSKVRMSKRLLKLSDICLDGEVFWIKNEPKLNAMNIYLFVELSFL